jgi:hypothetical protein
MGRWLILAGMADHRVCGRGRDKRGHGDVRQIKMETGDTVLGTALGGMRAHDTTRRFCLCRWGREEQAACAGLAQGAFTAGQRRCLEGEGQGTFAASSRVGLPMNTNAALYLSWPCSLLDHTLDPIPLTTIIGLARTTHFASRTTHHAPCPQSHPRRPPRQARRPAQRPAPPGLMPRR